MKHKEKINYLRVATAIAGYNFESKDLDLILELHSLVLKKEGEADLHDVVKAMSDIHEKYEKRNPIILEQHLKFEVHPEDLGKYGWGYAKIVCEELGDGWRLPTREELRLMYLNKHAIDGFDDEYYWSSTESIKSFNAYCQDFKNGKMTYNYKDYTLNVRAVRDI
jgi:hypothetical protein